jgi:hypothetical protein
MVESDVPGMVAAIGEFAAAAIVVAREARPLAQWWPDQRGLLGSIPYLRSLAECWAGQHTSYALTLTALVPAWWPTT